MFSFVGTLVLVENFCKILLGMQAQKIFFDDKNGNKDHCKAKTVP